VRALPVALALTGCATYDSTYWRHPTTGVTVECEASWSKFDQAHAWRDYCDRLMQRAGLVRITHEEGKEWERTGIPAAPIPTRAPIPTPVVTCPGNTFWNGAGCTSR
jgi:hypothetical protein